MRRTSVYLLSAIVLLGIALSGSARFTAAQDPSDVDHPAQGSWLVESIPGDAEYSPRMMILSRDGSALFVSGQTTTAVGGWEPRGDATAIATFTVVTNGPAYIVIRASLDIAPDGQSFTGNFTNEIVFDPAGGGTSGEIGPGTLTGARLTVEAPGTPVQSFEDFFRLPDGTPTP